MSVQVTSKKKESKRRRSSDKSTDLNERKKINMAESSFVEDDSSEEEHEGKKAAEIRMLYPTQLIQVPYHQNVLDKEPVAPKFFIARGRLISTARKSKK